MGGQVFLLLLLVSFYSCTVSSSTTGTSNGYFYIYDDSVENGAIVTSNSTNVNVKNTFNCYAGTTCISWDDSVTLGHLFISVPAGVLQNYKYLSLWVYAVVGYTGSLDVNLDEPNNAYGSAVYPTIVPGSWTLSTYNISVWGWNPIDSTLVYTIDMRLFEATQTIYIDNIFLSNEVPSATPAPGTTTGAQTPGYFYIYDDSVENGAVVTSNSTNVNVKSTTNCYAGTTCISWDDTIILGHLFISLPTEVLQDYQYLNLWVNADAGYTGSFDVNLDEPNNAYGTAVYPTIVPGVWTLNTYNISVWGWNPIDRSLVYTIDMRLFEATQTIYIDNIFLSNVIPGAPTSTGSTTGAQLPASTSTTGSQASVICSNTSSLPQLDSTKTSISSDTLTVTVDLSLDQQWLSTSINVGNSANSACVFVPTVSQATCSASFALQLPWASHSLCNFVEDDTDPDYLIFRAPIYVTTIQSAGQLHGIPVNHTEVDILNIAVSLPKSVSVSASVQLVAPVDLESEVTFQEYDPSSSIGTITFETSLQWPFELESGAVSSLPSGITLKDFADVTSNGACGTVNGTTCLQTFTFHVAPTNSCQLTGDYVVNFQVACRGSSQCPLSASATAQLTFSITSTDFCATVGTDVNVTASLVSYSDQALQTPHASFVVGQTGYFLVTVSSTAIPLSLTQLDSVVVVQGQNSFSLSSSSADVSQVTNGASTASFALLFDSASFSVPVDGSVTYGLTVKVDLTFANTRKREFQWRTISSQEIPITVSGSSDSSSAPPQITSHNNHRSIVIGTTVGIIVGVVGLVTVGLVTLKIYKGKQEKKGDERI